MAVVSYNEEKMAEVISAYSVARQNICGDSGANSIINHNIDRIEKNWSGTDARKAFDDLEAVKAMMGEISTNIENIYNALKDVQQNFGQIKWTE